MQDARTSIPGEQQVPTLLPAGLGRDVAMAALLSQGEAAATGVTLPARANAVSRPPASPPFPPRPGRFPGRRCAAQHSHHPAAASPALHPGVRCLPLRTDAGHGRGGRLVPWGGTGRWASPPIPLGTAETRLWAGVSPGKSRAGELFLLPRNGSCSPCHCPEPPRLIPWGNMTSISPQPL